MKTTITMDDKLFEKVNNYADELYTSRSGFIAMACTNYINQLEATNALKNLSLAMEKIASSNKIDDEAKELLEDFERFSNMFLGKN